MEFCHVIPMFGCLEREEKKINKLPQGSHLKDVDFSVFGFVCMRLKIYYFGKPIERKWNMIRCLYLL